MYNIPIRGTYRTFINVVPGKNILDEIKWKECKKKDSDEKIDMVEKSKKYLADFEKGKILVLDKLTRSDEELATFINFAITCPDNFYVSAHVYNVLK